MQDIRAEIMLECHECKAKDGVLVQTIRVGDDDWDGSIVRYCLHCFASMLPRSTEPYLGISPRQEDAVTDILFDYAEWAEKAKHTAYSDKIHKTLLLLVDVFGLEYKG